MMAFSVAPVGCCSNAITRAVLLVLRPTGRALRLAFFPALPFFDATGGLCAPTVGFRCWIAFQIRVTASSRLVNFFTGTTPGRLFQISISRGPGHSAASLPSSFGLLNVSVPSALPSVCFKEAWKVTLFSESIVNVCMECPFLRSRRWNPAVDDIHPFHEKAKSSQYAVADFLCFFVAQRSSFGMLMSPGRRIGLCGDAPRAPTQRPGFGGCERNSRPLPMNPGGKAVKSRGFGGRAPNSCSLSRASVLLFAPHFLLIQSDPQPPLAPLPFALWLSSHRLLGA